MEIKQMIYFKTIVEEGTISKAAQALHMAQPPLSMQLKQLEEELGVQLINRGHRKIELTQAGRLFYKRSLQMIALSEMTAHELKDTQHEMVRIGITSSNSVLVREIQGYIVKNPHLSFRIHEGSTYEIIDLLLAHNIDVGIVRTPFDQSQVEIYELRKEAMVAVGKDQYLNPSMTQMKNYKNLPLIIHQRYLPLVTDYCLNLHFNPFIKMSSDDCRTSLIWAKLGLGIAIIPQSALPLVNDTDLIAVTLEDQELYTNIVFITRRQEKLNPRIKELIQQFFN
ncbi:MAG: LysR family transcriptional regulator [Turicibacter sp.]|nr:LysR family transcriptional regulator [Turicibacter sp.]